MQATIKTWGNSLALRLPRHVADQLRLVDGTTIELELVEDGSLRVTPTRKKFNLSELLANEPVRDKRSETREHDWGEEEGDEVW